MPNQITITVFTIDELEPKAKRRALDKWRENMPLHSLEDFMIDEIRAQFEEQGFTFEGDIFQPAYSLGFCQSDFLAVSGTLLWAGHRVHYQYKSYGPDHLECETFTGDDEKIFKELYKSVCRAVLRAGHDEVMALTSDEYVCDEIRANEVRFLATGAIAPQDV